MGAGAVSGVLFGALLEVLETARAHFCEIDEGLLRATQFGGSCAGAVLGCCLGCWLRCSLGSAVRGAGVHLWHVFRY